MKTGYGSAVRMLSNSMKQNATLRCSTGDGQRPEVGWKQASQGIFIDNDVGNSKVGFEKYARGDEIKWNSGPDKKSVLTNPGLADGIFGRRSSGQGKNLKIVTGRSVGRKTGLSYRG
jgi:hypothetical protein